MITLIGKKLAKPGQEFIHFGVGNSRECMGCKLRKVCDNLQVGRRYVVRSSMNKPHEKCKIHEEGVMLVEVEPAEIHTVIPSESAKAAEIVIFIHPECTEYTCESRDLCFPEGLHDGDRCEIVKVFKKEIVCQNGAKVSSAIVKISEEQKHH